MRRFLSRLSVGIRGVPPERAFLFRLFATLVGTLLLVGTALLASESAYTHQPLITNQLETQNRFLLWTFVAGLALAIPVHYLLGGRRLATKYAGMQEQVTHDDLTGLPNQRAFLESLGHEVSRTKRFGGVFTLALVDIDDFTFVTDSLGHQHADDLLIDLAYALRAGRSVDRAFRIGGDEFAVLMAHTNLAGAILAIERLKAAALHSLGGPTISAGLVEFDPLSTDSDSTTDAAALRERAELALSEAKRRGRNTVVSFQEIADSAPARTSAATITGVRHLLATRQMGAAFQPIWNLDTHRVLGYEGLARPAAEYGLAGPEAAFSGAARLGRTDELDALCREAVFAGVSQFPDDALLFLNLSPEVLDHGAQAGERLQQEVEAAGLRPDRVVIELTERASERLKPVLAPVQALRELGFRLALDDVGAGAGVPSGDSGLALLGAFRPDYVKVDRSVVCSARSGGTGRGVLAAIVSYAAGSGAVVIAEGIETEEILHHLQGAARTINRRARIVGGQGYLLGRPAVRPWHSDPGDPDLVWPLPSLV